MIRGVNDHLLSGFRNARGERARPRCGINLVAEENSRFGRSIAERRTTIGRELRRSPDDDDVS
jgi:hypothetical protein